MNTIGALKQYVQRRIFSVFMPINPVKPDSFKTLEKLVRQERGPVVNVRITKWREHV